MIGMLLLLLLLPLLLPASADTTIYTREALADKVDVDNFPRWNNTEPWKIPALFSGYITVNQTAGRALFYALVESPSPQSDPLVLWLNGGPGCSSIAYGFLAENGPFWPGDGGQSFIPNPWAWNKKATMLYVDSPVGTGFSYSNTSSDYNYTNDALTAADNLAFLWGFFLRFPHLQQNRLLLAGESYAGHYVPQLAKAILLSNAQKPPPAGGSINLQGIMLGNPYTSTADMTANLDTAYSHLLISDEVYQGLRTHCKVAQLPTRRPRPLAGRRRLAEDAGPSPACTAFSAMYTESIAGIDTYDIYADVCIDPAAVGPAASLPPAGLPPLSGVGGRNPWYDPCRMAGPGGSPPYQYLGNDPDVQRALHVTPGTIYGGTFLDCSNIYYNYDIAGDYYKSMLPVWQWLLSKRVLRVLLYSGDVDLSVASLGTRRWVAGLRRNVTGAFRPWRVPSSGQVGGFVVDYDGISFTTVRNAGHMVPYDQPERALHIFSRFVDDEPL